MEIQSPNAWETVPQYASMLQPAHRKQADAT